MSSAAILLGALRVNKFIHGEHNKRQMRDRSCLLPLNPFKTGNPFRGHMETPFVDSADPFETAQNAGSDYSLHYSHTKMCIKCNKMKTPTRNA